MLNSYQKIIKNLIDDRLKDFKGLDIFIITGVDYSNHTFTINKLNYPDSYGDVSILGLNLGHGRCQMRLPSVNDLVLVAFINNSENPVILGTLYDNLSTIKDKKIQLKDKEYFVNAQPNGAFLFFKEDNTIILRTPNGGKLKILDDGSFKLFNNNNYGIECDKDGNLILRGMTIVHTQTQGDF